jgi:hypothetical protein
MNFLPQYISNLILIQPNFRIILQNIWNFLNPLITMNKELLILIKYVHDQY